MLRGRWLHYCTIVLWGWQLLGRTFTCKMLPGLLSRLVTIVPLKLSKFTEVFEDEQMIEKKKKKYRERLILPLLKSVGVCIRARRVQRSVVVKRRISLFKLSLQQCIFIRFCSSVGIYPPHSTVWCTVEVIVFQSFWCSRGIWTIPSIIYFVFW